MPAKFMACTGQKISSPDKTKQNIETFRPCIFLLSLQKAYICTPSTMKANMTATAIPLPPGTAQNHQAKQTHDTASCHAATIALAEYSPARTSITTRTLRHISRKIRKQKEPDDRLRRHICDERPCILAEHLRPRPRLRYT